VNNKTKAWIGAFRLRTLPLAFSTPALGSALAAYQENFRPEIFILATITTLLLQILSNLANDYGDAQKGTDNEERIGPVRGMQSGLIKSHQMYRVIVLFVSASLVSGVILIYEGTKYSSYNHAFWFLLLGFGALISAIKYTVGKKPFGYRALGDVFVFIWFGLVGVAGTYFLHTLTLPFDIFFPAASLGLLSAAVLNINNLRDWQSDRNAGKKTLVVMLGLKPAKIYHILLITVAVVFAVIYVILNYSSNMQWLFLVSIPFLFINLYSVVTIKEPQLLDPYLKKMALNTFAYAITFGGGFILSMYA
jgi:1,4-dihydroxy-2-naphthoate polyprenyltransferase